MYCEECNWPIISTIRSRPICPHCYHRERGIMRPPTPQNICKTHVAVTVRMPIQLYETLQPLAIQAGCTVSELIRRHLSDLTQEETNDTSNQQAA